MNVRDFIGPRRPWHVAAGLTPADLAANLDALRAETAGLTKREKNSALWADSFDAARRHGFDVHPGQRIAADGTPHAVPSAGQIATAEVRTASRFRAPDPHARVVRPINPSLYGLEYGLVFDGEKVRRAADCDDATAFISAPDAGHGPTLPVHSAVTAERRALVEQANFDFYADARAETGAGVSPEQYAKMQKRRGELRAMSRKLVSMLQEAGVEAERAEAAKLFVYWIHSKSFEELPAFRRICFIPEVAAAIRAPKLAALEFWLDRHPHARFWTFTTGRRCTLDELEDRLDWLHRRISKLNHLLKRYGVEIVFRSAEFGTLEKHGQTVAEREEGGGLEFNAEGAPLFHPHAHCVVVAKFGFNVKKWQAACQVARDFWHRDGVRLHCDFGAIIGNARECVKYVTKPGDLLKLRPLDLARLFEITYRAKLCHPMGSLAREIREREGHTVEIENRGPEGNARQARTLAALAVKHGVSLDDLKARNPHLAEHPHRLLDFGTRVVIFPGGKCLRRVRQGRCMVWVERLDHNKLNRETEAEKAERHAREDALAAAMEAEQFERCAPSAPGALDGRCPSMPSPLGSTCRVMARIMPAAGPRRVKEPRVIVLSADGRVDLAAVASHPLVISLWEETRNAWCEGVEDAAREDMAAAVLDRYSVHTGTPTVHDPAETAPPDPLAAALEAERETFKASADLAAGINF